MAKYKIGDRLKCLPGFKAHASNSGGAGYEEGLIVTIRDINKYKEEGGNVYWINEKKYVGIYERALILADSIINQYEIY